MKTAISALDQRALLLQIVDEAYRLPTWNGTNLRASIRRVPVEGAVWRPPTGRRSIADIVVHCAYWKYAIRRNLTDEPRGSFPFKGSNWCRVPAPDNAAEWAGYVALLDEQHQLLHDAISAYPKSLEYSNPRQQKMISKIYGLAIHDAYHTGQVHLIKKLWLRGQKVGARRKIGTRR